MTSEIFADWMRQFTVQVKERPILLIMDGHRTHVSLETIKVARDNDITLLKLPSHTTHLLQPLDKSCFKPMKVVWDKKVALFQRENGFRGMHKSEFVDILCSAWPKGLTPSNIIAGFRSCGIYPVCREQYPTEVFNPEMLMSYKVQKGLPKPDGDTSAAAPVSFLPSTSGLVHPSLPGVPDFPMPPMTAPTQVNIIAPNSTVASSSAGPSTSAISPYSISHAPLLHQVCFASSVS
jgi:hypothetical protein